MRQKTSYYLEGKVFESRYPAEHLNWTLHYIAPYVVDFSCTVITQAFSFVCLRYEYVVDYSYTVKTHCLFSSVYKVHTHACI